MTLQHSLKETCQSLKKKGDWFNGSINLAGDRIARLVVANMGDGYITALRVYDKHGETISNPVMTFDVLREKLGGVRIDSDDIDTLYLYDGNGSPEMDTFALIIAPR